MNKQAKRKKYHNAAYRLATEGWALFVAGKVRSNQRRRGRKRGGKRHPHQPYACEKADVFVAAQYEPGECRQPAFDANPLLDGISIETPTAQVIEVAALTECACHSGMTRDQLWDYLFDDARQPS